MARLLTRSARGVALATACSLVIGCHTTREVRASDLRNLDGYARDERSLVGKGVDAATGKGPRRYELRAVGSDRTYEFRNRSRLVLRLGPEPSRREYELQLQSVDIDTSWFVARTIAGGDLRLPLGAVTYAAIREFSWPKTLMLVGTVTLATLLALSVVVLATGDGGGGGGGDDDD